MKLLLTVVGNCLHSLNKDWHNTRKRFACVMFLQMLYFEDTVSHFYCELHVQN